MKLELRRLWNGDTPGIRARLGHARAQQTGGILVTVALLWRPSTPAVVFDYSNSVCPSFNPVTLTAQHRRDEVRYASLLTSKITCGVSVAYNLFSTPATHVATPYGRTRPQLPCSIIVSRTLRRAVRPRILRTRIRSPRCGDGVGDVLLSPDTMGPLSGRELLDSPEYQKGRDCERPN